MYMLAYILFQCARTRLFPSLWRTQAHMHAICTCLLRDETRGERRLLTSASARTHAGAYAHAGEWAIKIPARTFAHFPWAGYQFCDYRFGDYQISDTGVFAFVR